MTEHEYLQEQNLSASNRLLMQYFLWRDHFGRNLHPSVRQTWQREGGSTLAIADVACGNAIWLIDELPSHPPTTQFVGLDLSGAQFPAQSTWPANLILDTYDFYTVPPPRYTEAFDAVNVRLVLAGGVQKNDPVPVLRNLLAMLKPGGFLQWGEVEPGNQTFQPPPPRPPSTPTPA